MSALERQIIEKFRQLSPENRMRMLLTLQAEMTAQQMNLADGREEAEAGEVLMEGFIPKK